MRIFRRTFSVDLILLLTLFSIRCKNESPTQTLPQGCQSQGVYAVAVLKSDLACLPTNAYTDVTQALGSPNAGETGSGKLELFGFVSLGINGSITLDMGSCIQDLSGPDLRVYQTVASEAVEVQVSDSVDGPFVSLGTKPCGDNGPSFSRFCEFDLAGSGFNNVRIVKVFDRESLFFTGSKCDNAGPSPGADIDAVEVLYPAP